MANNIYFLLLLGVIALSSILNLFKGTEVIQQGYTIDEVKELLEIELLQQENITRIETIKIIEDGFEKDSVFIHNASKSQLDSLFTEYFRNR